MNAGGVIAIRIHEDDAREVFVSPLAYDFAHLIPASELAQVEDGD